MSGKSRNKVLLCTIPRSGGVIVSNFLKELGIKDSMLHLNAYEYSDYSGSTLDSAKKSPELYRKESNFSDAVNRLEDNQFAVGHFSIHNLDVLGQYKKIFLYRNLKDCLVSFGIWTSKTERWKKNERSSNWRSMADLEHFISSFLKAHGNAITSLFKKTAKWMDAPDTCKISYEKLIGNQGKSFQIKEFKKITNYLDIGISDRELESKIANALNKNSLTKITSKREYSYYWDTEFSRFFKTSGLKSLNKNLGYKEHSRFSIKNLFSVSKNFSFYDSYWRKNKKSVNTWEYGINIVDNLIDNFNFNSVLDAGCGSGEVVRYFTSKGYNAKGIELSQYVLNEFADDLLKKNIVTQGSLLELPYDDNAFDVVFSSEVLEHIHEEDIPKVVSELVRVSKTMLFLTISLRPSSNFNKYHINLKSRNWWENQFINLGVNKDYKMLEKLQSKKAGLTNKDVLQIGPTKTHIHEMEWFIEEEPYNFNGELEPWYFIFKKNE